MQQFKCPVTLELSVLLFNLEKERLREIFRKKYSSLLQMWNLITDVLESTTWVWDGLTPKNKFKHPCKTTLILCLWWSKLHHFKPACTILKASHLVEHSFKAMFLPLLLPLSRGEKNIHSTTVTWNINLFFHFSTPPLHKATTMYPSLWVVSIPYKWPNHALMHRISVSV